MIRRTLETFLKYYGPLVALIICDLLLFPARFAGKIAGRTKRKKDKRELTGN